MVFREMAAGFQSRIANVVTKWEIKTKERYNILQADINILGVFQEKYMRAKQVKLGDELVHGAR
jgi:hypothetical protein